MDAIDFGEAALRLASRRVKQGIAVLVLVAVFVMPHMVSRAYVWLVEQRAQQITRQFQTSLDHLQRDLPSPSSVVQPTK